MRSARPASGLTPPTDDEFATREAQLRHALPVLTCLSGLIAATAAASQFWLGTGHFRPLAFALHLSLAGLGAAWFRWPPVHASRAAFLVGVYLSTLIGTFILKSGDLSSCVNLALVSLGAAFMIADRRYLFATQLVVIAWFLIAIGSPLQVPSRLQYALCGAMVVATAAAVHLARRRAVRKTVGRAAAGRSADLPRTATAARVGGSSAIASPGLSREVVHDVNNLLGGILGGAELALASEQHPEDLQLALRQIRERVLATRDYMRGASQAGGKLESVDVNGVLERAVGLARGLAGRGIKLVLDLEPEIPPIEADRIELERAILNLLANAIDASAEGSGEIRVRSRRIGEDAAPVVLVRVEDDGQGVPEADRARIFTPGFTTRGGDHQGLGLPFVAQVARRSGGEVRLDPRVGSGAAFEMRIPASGPATGLAPQGR